MQENQNKRTGLGAPAPVTSTENVAEFEAALKRFVDELQPRGIVEETLVFHLGGHLKTGRLGTPQNRPAT